MSWYGTACTACPAMGATNYNTPCTAQDHYHDLKCKPGTMYENGECGDKDTIDKEYIHGIEVACTLGDVTVMDGVAALPEKQC